MKKQKVIVLGANGMAGHVLTLKLRDLPGEFETIAVSRSKNEIGSDAMFEVSDFSKLEKFVRENNPDIIVNCIGILNRTSEDRPDQAILMNGYFPHFLEQLTRDTSCRVISISTDCVFSGKKGGYREDDLKDGRDFYSMSKSIGEIVNQKDLTIRTSIIGPELKKEGIGLFHWFMQQHGEVNGYTQAYWSGVATTELADAVIEAIRQNLNGLYQLVYKEKISKFDLIGLMKEVFDKSDVSIKPYDGYAVDKSMIGTRTDFKYEVPSYKKMLEDMKDWISAHPGLYPYES